MRILIYGAGVIGSLYAALLADAGYDTSIYARGKRLEILKNNGLLYKKNQDLIKAKIKIIEEVPNDDIYDFILLTVRENQLYEALTELKNNKSNTIVTMVNSLDSYKKWEDIVGTGRILPAFPGAGGSIMMMASLMRPLLRGLSNKQHLQKYQEINLKEQSIFQRY